MDSITELTWLGSIPDSWEIARIDAFYSLRNKKVSDRDYAPLSVTMQGIKPQLETVAKTNAHDDRKLVLKNDFVINSRSDRRGSCGISPQDGSVSLINTVLAPRSNMHAGYYGWIFRTSEFADEFYKWGHGIVDDLWTTNWQDMKRILMPKPPIEEQSKIADFLDEKCAEIDNLIKDAEKQVELLEEYHKAVVYRTVTSGLRHEEMKSIDNCGWASHTPKSWEFLASKHEVIIANGSNPQTNEGPTPVYGSGLKSFKTCVESKIGPAVLLGRKGTVNIPQFVSGNYWNVDTAFDAKIKPGREYSLKFFYYCACCFDYDNYSTQTALPSMTQSDYDNIKIPRPSLSEQNEIVEFLDSFSKDLNEGIALKQNQINTLRNYKKSLIYEYVTGKKRV